MLLYMNMRIFSPCVCKQQKLKLEKSFKILMPSFFFFFQNVFNFTIFAWHIPFKISRIIKKKIQSIFEAKIWLGQKFLSSYIHVFKYSTEKLLLCGATCTNTWPIHTAIDEAWWLIYRIEFRMSFELKSLLCKLFIWRTARRHASFLLHYSWASHDFCLSLTSIHLRMK